MTKLAAARGGLLLRAAWLGAWLLMPLGLAACGGDGGHAERDAAAQLDGGAADAATTPDLLSEAELGRIVATLAADDMGGRAPGTAGGVAARAFIAAEWARCGIAPAGTSGFEQAVGATSAVNLIGRIEGTDPTLRERHVLLSAHYDHVGTHGGTIYNGAYDNATAVAGVIAVACHLAGAPPRRSVLVAHWDAEEPPAFLSADMGSEYFAAHPLVPLDRIDVAIVLDLYGADLWPGFQGHFVLGAETSAAVTAAVTGAAAPAGLAIFRGGLHLAEEQPFGHQPWSDYDGFRNRAVPVLFLSDGQTKRYHEPDDDFAAIDLPKLLREAQYLRTLVTALATATETPAFDAAGADYGADGVMVVAGLEAALAAGGLVETLGLGATSRTKLEQDLADATAARDRIVGGQAASPADIATLRRGVQRLMCLAGSSYSEATCNMM